MIKNKLNRRIIVIGGLHHNTLGVIRSLGEEGIKSQYIIVLLIGIGILKNNILSNSKYIDRYNIFNLNSNNEIIPWLLNNLDGKEKACVICCTDASSEIVIKNKNILKDYYLLPDLCMDIEKMMSKHAQNEVAKKIGMNIPHNIVINTENPYKWDMFPCITKPLKSADGGGKADIHIAKSESELKKIISNVKAKNLEIQYYIEKKMEYQLIGCSINGGEKIIIPGFTNIIRQPQNTNTGYLKYSPIKELKYNEKAVTDFIKTIGYSGLFSMEFIRDKNGVDYFLEINMRNDGNAYCVKTAGVNLPYIWCCSLVGLDVDEQSQEIKKSVYFMPDFIDLKMGIHAVGIFKWIQQFFEAKSHSLYNISDINPFLYALRIYCKQIVKRILRIE